MKGMRKSGLTLAPEVARDDMREQIRKKIKNDDLLRRLPGGVQERLAAGEALFPVRPAGRTAGRSRRHRRLAETISPHRQGSAAAAMSR